MAWHAEFQKWLSESQSLDNAQKIVDYLYKDGSDWSKESISALIGNMRHESSVNPNMYEYGYDWSADRGYGLVQWTPRSKYWNWAEGKGLDPEKGESQLARIDYEVEHNIQWIAKDSVFNGLTFKEFRTNSRKLTVEQLTEAFTWGYERPNQQAGEESMPARQAFAKKAFNELKWGGTNQEPNPVPDPQEPQEPIIDIDFSPITDFFSGFMEDILKEIETMIKELLEEFIKIIDKILEAIEKMLTVDLYKYGVSNIQGNHFLKVTKQLENMNKIRPTLNFFEELNKIKKEGEKLLNEKINSGYDRINKLVDDGKKLLGNVIDKIEPDVSYPNPNPNPGEEPNPNPSGKKYFPVDYNASGVNFWKKSNWSAGQLQYEMCYGYTRNGGSQFHAGYDIGAGGVTGLSVHATNDGVVQFARWSDSAGFMIQIKHDDDEYYSTYMHLVNNSNVVKQGEKVKAGQKIATMGNTPGGGMAVHLHYVLSKDGSTNGENSTFDPEKYLGVTGDNKTSLPYPK